MRALSELPSFSVLMATSISGRDGIFRLPRHTSPNSPPPEPPQREIISKCIQQRRLVACESNVTDYCFDGDVGCVDLPREFPHRLVGILIGVRIDVGSRRVGLREQRRRHCNHNQHQKSIHEFLSGYQSIRIIQRNLTRRYQQSQASLSSNSNQISPIHLPMGI